MIITIKNQSEIMPFVETETFPIDSGWTTGATTTGTYSVYTYRTQPTYQNTYRLTLGTGVTWTNLDPTVLDLSEFPTVKAAASPSGPRGLVRFTRGSVSIKREFDISVVGNPMTFSVPDSILTGTLLEFTHNIIHAKASLSGKDNHYYRITGGSGALVMPGNGYLNMQPNPDCWADFDFSGVPVWNSSGSSPGQGGGAYHGGVLLQCTSNRVLVEAEHFGSPVGTVFAFMQADGTLVYRTSIAVNPRPAGANSAETLQLMQIPGDIRVHILDSPVPTGIKAYPISGPWSQLARTTGATSEAYPWQTAKTSSCPVVTVYLDENRRAWFLGSYAMDCEVATHGVASTTWNGTPIELLHSTCGCTGLGVSSPFAENITNATYGRHRSGIVGSSGSCLFVPLSATELAIFTCLTVPGGGPSYQESRLNVLIAAACAAAGIPPVTVTVALSPV